MNGTVGTFSTHSCDACRLPCGLDRYHCQECADFDLCPACFSKRPECDAKHTWFSHENTTDAQIKERVLTRSSLGVGPLIYHALRQWKTRPCVGFTIDPDAPPPRKYTFVTYDEIKKLALQLLLGLHMRLVDIFGDDDARVQHNYDPEEDETPTRACIFLRNSPAFVVADVACAIGGFTSVPIDPHASREALTHILSITTARLILVDAPHAPILAVLLSSGSFPALRLVVLMEPTDAFTNAPNLPSTLVVVRNVDLLKGLEVKHKDMIAELKQNDFAGLVESRVHSDVFTLIFTSGSTGRPKGAIQTHQIWSQDTFELDLYSSPYVSVVYRPLCYATDREILWRALSNGGRVAIFASDMSTLFDDLASIGPSSFSGPPRVWNVLYDQFNRELAKRIAQKESVQIADNHIRMKLLEEYSKKVGPRCRSIGVGGAAARPEVFAFMKAVFENSYTVNRVYESYGTTENGGITINGVIPSYIEVMLIDVPEMGFFTTNTPPQGEVCVITRDAIPGYWRDEDNTAKLFHICDKGKKWIRTGDIGEFRGTKLQLIDRRGNVVKLANSTFISPETLESVFINCASVRDVFVYADSSWEFPLAVATLADPKGPLAQRPRHEQQSVILAEMRALAATREVLPTHVPHGVLIEPEWFTVENQSLTISLKTARANLKLRYQAALREMYASIMGGPAKEPAAAPEEEPMLRRESSSVIFDHHASSDDEELKALQEELCRLIAKLLQHQRVEATETPSGLGADSISIARIRERIRKFSNGIDIPVDTLWHSSIADLAKLILARRRNSAAPYTAGGATPPPVSTNSTQQLIRRLQSDSQWHSNDLITDFDAPSQADTAERHLLLTGATGFVGSHVLRAILLRADASSASSLWSSVICLVRAASDEDAAERIVSTLTSIKVSDTISRRALASGKLRVVACDLDGMEHLRAITNFALIRQTVTHIIHAAAGVNHVLPHSSLAPANIESTRALLNAFASRHNTRLAHFCFVSTVSAISLSQSQSVDDESLPMVSIPSFALSKHPPSGYSSTKWCAERLVVQASQDDNTCLGTMTASASIVRLGMTGWCTQTGAGNPSDWVTALASSCALLAVHPAAVSRKINLLPVDAVANALEAIATAAPHDESSASRRPRPPTVIHLVSGATVDIQTTLASLSKEKAACSAEDWIQRLQEAASLGTAPKRLRSAAALFPSVEYLPTDEAVHQPRLGDAVLSRCNGNEQDALSGSAGRFEAWIQEGLGA